MRGPREALRLREGLAVGPDTTPREVERHRRKSSIGKAVSEMWKETPVLEPFEAVTDHDGGPSFAVPNGPHGTPKRAAVCSLQLK